MPRLAMGGPSGKFNGMASRPAAMLNAFTPAPDVASDYASPDADSTAGDPTRVAMSNNTGMGGGRF